MAAIVFWLPVLLLSACRSQPPTPTATPGLLPTPESSSTPFPTGTLTLTQELTPTVIFTPTQAISFPKIDRSPRPATLQDWAPWAGQTLTTTLEYDPTSLDIWQIDYRTQDLSQLDLRSAVNDLLLAFFDDRTLWPPAGKMPIGFDPQRILKLGKDPGLGVRSLHARGTTGESVGIAMIDLPLLVDHQEYRDRLRLYEELFFGEEAYQQPADMHGSLVASVAVGQATGVAPQADLYYIAVDLASGKDADGNYRYDLTKAAQAIRRILEINQQLPAERKIRVISIAFGWASGITGYEEISAAVAEARLQGLFVVSAYPVMEQVYGFKLSGLERAPLADPDSVTSYTRPHACFVYASSLPMCQEGRLLVPMNSRTAASPMGPEEYAFYRMGDESETVPYLAGVYALAAQVDPQITPERFWELALQTGRRLDISGTSGNYTLQPVLDPVGVVGEIGK
jgi:hypothetical protein